MSAKQRVGFLVSFCEYFPSGRGLMFDNDLASYRRCNERKSRVNISKDPFFGFYSIRHHPHITFIIVWMKINVLESFLCLVTVISVTRCWTKELPKFPQKLPKSIHSSFSQLWCFFNNSPTVTKYLGYFCKKICSQELSKSRPIWSHWIHHRHRLLPNDALSF